MKWLPLRYQGLCLLSVHSLLLGGSPDGLTYHSQVRTELSCSSGPRLRQVARAGPNSINHIKLQAVHHVANTAKSELQARQPGHVGGSDAHSTWKSGTC